MSEPDQAQKGTEKEKQRSEGKGRTRIQSDKNASKEKKQQVRLGVWGGTLSRIKEGKGNQGKERKSKGGGTVT